MPPSGASITNKRRRPLALHFLNQQKKPTNKVWTQTIFMEEEEHMAPLFKYIAFLAL